MFYLLILSLQMKLIKQITDLNKAVYIEKRLGFVPTMGSLHKGHEELIKTSINKCKKIILVIIQGKTKFFPRSFASHPTPLIMWVIGYDIHLW